MGLLQWLVKHLCRLSEKSPPITTALTNHNAIKIFIVHRINSSRQFPIPPFICLSVLIKYFIIPSTLLLLTLADGISFLCPSLSLAPSLSLRASCCAVKRVGESSLRLVGEDAQQCPPLFVVVVHRTSGGHHQQCQEQTMVQWVRVHEKKYL